MWTYLKSIGFEDIPNNDDRLGAQGAPDAIHWEHTIARDNLCAFCNEPTGSYTFLSDLNNYNLTLFDYYTIYLIQYPFKIINHIIRI